jgi:hypothetical protein
MASFAARRRGGSFQRAWWGIGWLIADEPFMKGFVDLSIAHVNRGPGSEFVVE